MGRSAVVWAREYSNEKESGCDCETLKQVLKRVPGAERMVSGGGGMLCACLLVVLLSVVLAFAFACSHSMRMIWGLLPFSRWSVTQSKNLASIPRAAIKSTGSTSACQRAVGTGRPMDSLSILLAHWHSQ